MVKEAGSTLLTHQNKDFVPGDFVHISRLRIPQSFYTACLDHCGLLYVSVFHVISTTCCCR